MVISKDILIYNRLKLLHGHCPFFMNVHYQLWGHQGENLQVICKY